MEADRCRSRPRGAAAVLRATGAVLLASAVGGLAAERVPREAALVFAEGATSATLADRIEGRGSVDIRYTARAGEPVVASVDSPHPALYFNVLPPGSTDEAIFIGSVEGSRFEGVLGSAGTYTFRVYLMAAAGRRGESGDFTFTLQRVGAPAVAARFDSTLSLHGVTFHVGSPNTPDGNTLRIETTGIADPTPIEQAVDGLVTGAEIADLDVDQAPEVYVYVREPGAAARMTLVAYSSNRNRSLSGIYLTPLEDTPGATAGYTGHDAMAVVESVFARRFPIEGGKTRQLQYRLVPGEAGWRLVLDRMMEF